MGRNSVVGGSGSSSFTGRAPNAQMIGALVHRQSKKKKLWVSPSVGDVWLPALALIYLLWSIPLRLCFAARGPHAEFALGAGLFLRCAASCRSPRSRASRRAT